MKLYASHGFNEFFVALGYKGEVIKRYFLDYHALNGSMSVNTASGAVMPFVKGSEDWTVNLVETGHDTQTGGRLRRLRPWLSGEHVHAHVRGRRVERRSRPGCWSSTGPTGGSPPSRR